MIVYEATKEEFVDDVLTNELARKVEQRYRMKVGSNPNPREITAWQNSMQYMKDVLADESIPKNCGVAIEYKIPYTSKRIDFIITGKDEGEKRTGVIIELKQWQKAEIASEKDGIVKDISTYTGGAVREVTHPSYQAWSYKVYLEDYNEMMQTNNVILHPCAYLHNYIEVDPPVIQSPFFKHYIDLAPIFVSGDYKKLRNFISQYVKYGDAKETIYLIENGKIKPSKALQDCIASMLKNNPEFVLLDNQKVVYETALKMARKSYKDNQKRCLIVKGGPGTGKTVLAINLLAKLTNEEMVCQYCTKNAAPRNVFETKLTGTFQKTRIHNMFKGSGSYVESANNEMDVILVDEAHRLNEKSGMFRNLGENQIKEIIKAAKLSVFFIDESQRIDIHDIGTVEEIKKYVEHYGIAEDRIEELELESQFRCNGSDGYLAWIDDVLEIRETANKDGFEMNYDIQVFDSPTKLKEKIFELNKINNKARLVAGYCYDWVTKNNPRGDGYDIEFPKYDFKMKWNLNNTSTWAIDSESVNEVGCIHTSQGLEFDYVGVIIGKDLRYENGKVVTDFTQRAKTDHSLKGIKSMFKEEPEKALKIADTIIKNTYRTLMTRGTKCCYVYCEDKALAEYLKERIARISSGCEYSVEDASEVTELKVAEDGTEYRV